MGCRDGAVICVLIVDAVLWSLQSELERFNPRESWEDPLEGIHAGGGWRVPFTLRRAKLLSQPQQYHSTQIAWH